MKRRITALVFALAFLTMCSFICFADDTYFNIVAQSDKTELSKGDTFSVSFYTNNISEPSGILSLEGYIEYDPTSLKLLGLEEIVPNSWGDDVFIQYNERTSGNKCRIQLTLCWDGDSNPTNLVIKNNNEFGVKLDFSVETINKTTTTVDFLSDSLVATSFLPDIKCISGNGTFIAIKLNGSEEDVSHIYSSEDESSEAPSSEDPSSEDSSSESSSSEDSSSESPSSEDSSSESPSSEDSSSESSSSEDSSSEGSSSDDSSSEGSSSDDSSAVVSDDSSSETSNDSSSVLDESSNENSEMISEDISENSQNETSDSTEAISDSEVSTDESVVSDEEASVLESSTMGDTSVESSDSKENTTVSEDNDEKSGSNIILWLVLVCVVIAAIAVTVYIVKNKKDDMNPVNPG